jgi:alkylhydroperoxidase/carboxymuconolactone decarboxylase family protein YurZ
MASTDVREILTEAELTRLRDAFDLETMLVGARNSSAAYPPASTWNTWILDRFYEAGSEDNGLAAIDRERTVIALLTAEQSGLYLAIHVYWGLATAPGLSVNEIAQTMLLVGSYRGIDSFNAGLKVLQKTLGELKTLAAGEADPTADLVVGALARAFA